MEVDNINNGEENQSTTTNSTLTELQTGHTMLPLTGPINSPVTEKELELLEKSSKELGIDFELLYEAKDYIVIESPGKFDTLFNAGLNNMHANMFVGEGKTGGLGVARLIDILAVPALSVYDLAAKKHDVELSMARNSKEVDQAHENSPFWIHIPSKAFYNHHGYYPNLSSISNQNMGIKVGDSRENSFPSSNIIGNYNDYDILFQGRKNKVSEGLANDFRVKRYKADNEGLVGIETNPGPKINLAEQFEQFKLALSFMVRFNGMTSYEFADVYRQWFEHMHPMVSGNEFEYKYTARLHSTLQDFHSFKNLAGSDVTQAREKFFMAMRATRSRPITLELTELGRTYSTMKSFTDFNQSIRTNTNLFNGTAVGVLTERATRQYEGNYTHLTKAFLYMMDITWGSGCIYERGMLDLRMTSRDIPGVIYTVATPFGNNLPRSNHSGFDIGFQTVGCTLVTYINMITGQNQYKLDQNAYKPIFWRGGTSEDLEYYILCQIEYPYKYIDCDATYTIVDNDGDLTTIDTSATRNTTRVHIPEHKHHLLIVALDGVVPNAIGATIINTWDGDVAPVTNGISVDLNNALAAATSERWERVINYMREEITSDDWVRALYFAASVQGRNQTTHIYSDAGGAVLYETKSVTKNITTLNNLSTDGAHPVVRNPATGGLNWTALQRASAYEWSFTGVNSDKYKTTHEYFENSDLQKVAIAINLLKVDFMGIDNPIYPNRPGNVGMIYCQVHDIAEWGFNLLTQYFSHIGLCTQEALYSRAAVGLIFNIDRASNTNRALRKYLLGVFGQIQTKAMGMPAVRTLISQDLQNIETEVQRLFSRAYELPIFVNTLKYSLVPRMVGPYRSNQLSNFPAEYNSTLGYNVNVLPLGGDKDFEKDEIGGASAAQLMVQTSGLFSAERGRPGLTVNTFWYLRNVDVTTVKFGATIGIGITLAGWAYSSATSHWDATNYGILQLMPLPMVKYLVCNDIPMLLTPKIATSRNFLATANGYLGSINDDIWTSTDIMESNQGTRPNFGDQKIADSLF